MTALVIGGGISGLVAARELARAGVVVTLAEAAPRLGGKVRTEHVDGFVIEHGPDSFLTTRPAAAELVHELGLADELVGTKAPRLVFIRRGARLLPMPEGLGLVLPTKLAPFVRTPLFSWPEKVRMALDLVAPRRLRPSDVAVGGYLRGRLGDAFVERLAGPLVGGVYGTAIDELSLDAVVPQLRLAEREHRSLLLAGLAQGRAMRRAQAARGDAPSAGPFVSLRGGMARLTDALGSSAAAAGADLQPDRPMRSLEPAGSAVLVRSTDGTARRFDAVVIATPAPVASALLEGSLPEASHALDAIPHGSSTLVSLAYPPGALAGGLVGHGYLVPRAEGGPVSACTWSSEKWPDRAPGGATLLRVFMRDEEDPGSRPDDAHIAAARTEAERVLGARGEPHLVRVTREAHAMPRYTVGHLARVEAIEASLSRWPALTVTGASYRGVGLPDCVSQGAAAAASVLARLA